MTFISNRIFTLRSSSLDRRQGMLLKLTTTVPRSQGDMYRRQIAFSDVPILCFKINQKHCN